MWRSKRLACKSRNQFDCLALQSQHRNRNVELKISIKATELAVENEGFLKDQKIIDNNEAIH